MTDYTELVKALRHCSHDGLVKCNECKYGGKEWPVGCEEEMMRDAAAAIEALEADVKRLEARVKAKESSKQRWKRLAMDTADYVDVVRCGECKWYDPLDKSRPFFCPVMDFANGVMEDDYCSRGERSAAMALQDIKCVTQHQDDADTDGFFKKAGEMVKEVQE